MKNLESEFVPYPLALRMKVLGYKESCLVGYELDVINDDNPELIFPNVIKQFNEEDEIFEDPVTTYPRLFTSTNDVVLTPTWQSAFKWFRDKHGIEGFIHKAIEGTYYFVIKRVGNNESNMYEFTKTTPKQFDTYEKAEIACLEKLIEIVEQKLKQK
jgi:dolichyl-phosphate-mannose--protein O-mannosyl transferase